MKKPKIISMIKVNGEWVNQDDLPQELVNEIVAKTLARAAANIGMEIRMNQVPVEEKERRKNH